MLQRKISNSSHCTIPTQILGNHLCVIFYFFFNINDADVMTLFLLDDTYTLLEDDDIQSFTNDDESKLSIRLQSSSSTRLQSSSSTRFQSSSSIYFQSSSFRMKYKLPIRSSSTSS